MQSNPNENPQTQTNRKFMSLGSPAVSRSGITENQFLGFPKPQQQIPIFPTSFIAQPQDQAKTLPDIFTTCPELRKFDMPLLVPKPVQNEFNLPMPAPRPAAPVPPPVWALVQVQRPVQISQPPPQLQQGYSKFDPNAPIIYPQELHFIPTSEWNSQAYSLIDLRLLFFTRRNGIGRVFPIKLYHALLITKKFPDSYWYTGVMWVTETVMKVNAHVFANLLGIHAVQGGLFHKQGNFTRHQFTQIMIQNSPQFQAMPECADVDDFSVRLFTDPQNRFSRDTEYDLSLDTTLLNME